MLTLQEVQECQEEVLHNMMQFYIYEFSKYIPSIRLDNNGLYKPFKLDNYWNNDTFHAFFINLDSELIGFVLMNSATESNRNTILEFFIMAKHSGNGFGKEIAKKMFTMFPGEWEITQIENNKPARSFWKGLIKELSNDNFKENYKDGKYTQTFSSVSLN
ncbi:GNAT family N-acetyltransferase [Oceanobacillus kapialis]|uniref:GNAT family N-acetyltransferase n=1 Tax=Oceanobacillus kapialis TaxID=481353 RepID=A0ABW5Q279_9BACI